MTVLYGSCHCGGTRFSVAHLPKELRECNCSFCTKRGALWAYFLPKDFELLSSTCSSSYRWNSKTVEHHFCSQCGCGTYSNIPAWTDDGQVQIGINARLLDDVSLTSIHIEKVNGRDGW